MVILVDKTKIAKDFELGPVGKQKHDTPADTLSFYKAIRFYKPNDGLANILDHLLDSYPILNKRFSRKKLDGGSIEISLFDVAILRIAGWSHVDIAIHFGVGRQCIVALEKRSKHDLVPNRPKWQRGITAQHPKHTDKYREETVISFDGLYKRRPLMGWAEAGFPGGLSFYKRVIEPKLTRTDNETYEKNHLSFSTEEAFETKLTKDKILRDGHKIPTEKTDYGGENRYSRKIAKAIDKLLYDFWHKNIDVFRRILCKAYYKEHEERRRR